MNHTRTDPICSKHRPPKSRIGWWWFNVNHGNGCKPCMLKRKAANSELANLPAPDAIIGGKQ